MSDVIRRHGLVSLVGAGPGDPGLLTRKAENLLGRADVVIHDALVSPAVIAMARQGAEIIHRRELGEGAQEALNQALIRHSRLGHRVVRLKGGDPCVFGRGGEEAWALSQAGLPFEIVPGVSAGIAAAAYAGIPLTHRMLASDVTFVTGHEDPAKSESAINWKQLVHTGGTLVIFMGVRHLNEIMDRLVENGISSETPAAVIEWATTPMQRTVVGTVGCISERVVQQGLDHPALTIVGRVVELRDDLAWFDRRPLWKRRILVTRAEEQAPELVEALREVGAGVITLPSIAFAPPSNSELLDNGVDELSEGERFDWVLFTSTNAVQKFFQALETRNMDLRVFGQSRIACIGPSTANSLKQYGIHADLIPEDHRAEGLLKALPEANAIRGKRFLFPRAEVARDIIPDRLRAGGGIVDLVPVYRTLRPKVTVDSAKHHLQLADTVTFTSPSAVNNLVAMLGEDGAEILATKTLAAIGPITSKALQSLGLKVQITARVSTVKGLVDAIVENRSTTKGRS
ncbi:MAG TPA: uroporphyrinogen-III C-methyltransferase [Myxococcales bacterium]|nr:uroporphyrinogen-III C-methyltransferase [Myxococcales bacterium]